VSVAVEVGVEVGGRAVDVHLQRWPP
jgi:hypothetical protein